MPPDPERPTIRSYRAGRPAHPGCIEPVSRDQERRAARTRGRHHVEAAGEEMRVNEIGSRPSDHRGES